VLERIAPYLSAGKNAGARGASQNQVR